MLPIHLPLHLAVSAVPPGSAEAKSSSEKIEVDSFILLPAPKKPNVNFMNSADSAYFEEPTEENLENVLKVYQKAGWGVLTIFPLELRNLGIGDIKDRIVANDNVVEAWFLKNTLIGRALVGNEGVTSVDVMPVFQAIHHIFEEGQVFRAIQENRILEQIVHKVEKRILKLIRTAHKDNPITENIQVSKAHSLMGNREEAYFYLTLARDFCVRKFNKGYVNTDDLIAKITILHRLVGLAEVKHRVQLRNYLEAARGAISSLYINDRSKGVIFSVDQAELWAEVNASYLRKQLKKGEINKLKYNSEKLQDLQAVADADRYAISLFKGKETESRYWSSLVNAKAGIVEQYTKLAKLIYDEEWIDREEYEMRNQQIIPRKYFPLFERTVGSKELAAMAKSETVKLQDLAKHIDKIPADIHKKALKRAKAALATFIICD